MFKTVSGESSRLVERKIRDNEKIKITGGNFHLNRKITGGGVEAGAIGGGEGRGGGKIERCRPRSTRLFEKRTQSSYGLISKTRTFGTPG